MHSSTNVVKYNDFIILRHFFNIWTQLIHNRMRLWDTDAQVATILKMAIFRTEVTVKVTRSSPWCQLKNFIGRVCIPNMYALSHMTPKLWTRLIFCPKLLFLEHKVTAKVTWSLILVSLESVLLVEYAFQIWSIYLVWFKSYDQC